MIYWARPVNIINSNELYTMKKLLLMLIVAAVAGYGLLSYHFILLDDSVKILKKTEPRTANTFVDGRGRNKVKLFLQPDLAAAGISDLLNQVEQAAQ